MAFWHNLFGNNSKVETPQQNNLISVIEQLKGETNVLHYDPMHWYKTNPFVFSSINERAKAVSNFRFYRETEYGERFEDELTVKLNEPNEYQSGTDYIKQLVTYQSIYGTGYAYINRLLPTRPLTDKNTEFINIPAESIVFENKLKEDQLANILKFNKQEIKIFYKSELELIPLDTNELIPFFDTTQYTNFYFSESRLKSLQYAVSNTQTAFESQNTFLSSPGGIGMITKKSRDGQNPLMTESERLEMEKAIQKKYGSKVGQNNYQIVGKDIEFISTMPDVRSLELNPTLVANALIIYGVYDLPKEILTALQSGSTFENQTAAYKRYMSGGAKELADNIAKSFDSKFPNPKGKLIASADHLPLMQEDEKNKAEVNKIEADATKIYKEVWDAWLTSGNVTIDQYNEFFNLK